MTTGLAGRRALVTGAGQGIGRAICERLADHGMRLTLVDKNPQVLDVASMIGGQGVVADLRDPTASRAALIAASGDDAYWLLVNNAGIFAKTPLLDTSIDEWDAMQEVNTRSMLVTMQAVVPAMRVAGGGRIVNMASMAAKRGTPGEAAYAASKSAVVALTRIASMEFGEHGITANSVCPGYVLTELGAATRTEAQVAEWSAMSPLGRLCEPSDVAALVAHLASDEAGYITGQALNVTGGMCTW